MGIRGGIKKKKEDSGMGRMYRDLISEGLKIALKIEDMGRKVAAVSEMCQD